MSDPVSGKVPFPIVAAFVLPHPPVIVPGVNGGPHLAGRTVEAFHRLAGEFAQIRPDTVVVISPHAPMFSDYLYLYDGSRLEGSLSRFGAPQARLSFDADAALRDDIARSLDKAGIAAGGLTSAQMRHFDLEASLDHGVVVPLYFLAEAYSDFKLVAMSSSNLPLPLLYQAGVLIREAAGRLGRRVVLVASGDQSHKVNQESPYGTCPEGSQYDSQVVASLQQADLVRLLSIDSQVRQKAAECGYRSLVMMCGAFGSQAIRSEVYNYEAPYGIGYCVAAVTPDPAGETAGGDPWVEALARSRGEQEKLQHTASAPVRIARMTLESYVRDRRRVAAADFRSWPDAGFLFGRRGGVFVSLKKFGELRGCIGTTAATTASLADEIIQNALSAGLHDPRFEPVQPDELADLVYSVDVLGDAENVAGKQDLDPAIYGVIVRNGSRSGLLLPDLEGVDSVDEQLAIACRKAGIRAGESYEMMRFTVTRYR
jgi:MEMO1 family protein